MRLLSASGGVRMNERPRVIHDGPFMQRVRTTRRAICSALIFLRVWWVFMLESMFRYAVLFLLLIKYTKSQMLVVLYLLTVQILQFNIRISNIIMSLFLWKDFVVQYEKFKQNVSFKESLRMVMVWMEISVFFILYSKIESVVKVF